MIGNEATAGRPLEWVWTYARKFMEHRANPLLVPPETPVQPGSVARFLTEALRPSDGAAIPVMDLIGGYPDWCLQNGYMPHDKQHVMREVARLFRKAGVDVEMKDGRAMAIDVKLVA